MTTFIRKPRDPVQTGFRNGRRAFDGAERSWRGLTCTIPGNQARRQGWFSITAKFPDIARAAGSKDVQAVIIAAPDPLHKQMLVDAVKREVRLPRETGDPRPGRGVPRGDPGCGEKRPIAYRTHQRSWPHYDPGKELARRGASGRRAPRDAFCHELLRVGVNRLPAVRRPRPIRRKACLGSRLRSRLSMKFRTCRQFRISRGNLGGLDDPAIDDRSLVHGVRRTHRSRHRPHLRLAF